MTAGRLPQTLERLAALGDPVRRSLYLFVAGRPGPVSRDQAARGAGVSRPLAAFHLDKLVEQGLLEATYRRLSARRGPGAGRPAKLYHRSAAQLDLSVPPRQYELAARLFAQALMTGPPSGRTGLHRAARDLGRRMAANARRARRAPSLRRVEALLRQQGYEPFAAAPDTLRLRNCPFDALARDYRPLMCGANHAFVEGMLKGLGATGCTARLDQQPGVCCVAVTARRR